LVLDAQLEPLSKLHYQCPRICVTYVGDQGPEAVQIVVYCPTSLVVGGSFQGVDRVHFHVYREEVNLELLFEVPLGLHGKNASVRFLTKDILGLLGGTTTLEKCESPENFFLFVAKLFQG